LQDKFGVQAFRRLIRGGGFTEQRALDSTQRLLQQWNMKTGEARGMVWEKRMFQAVYSHVIAISTVHVCIAAFE
jgi:hypothetical protein